MAIRSRAISSRANRGIENDAYLDGLVFNLGNKKIAKSATYGGGDVVLHYDDSGSVVKLEIRRVLESDAFGPDDKLFLTLRNAACSANVHPASLRKLANQGRLRAMKINGEWLTTVGWLEDYLRNRRPPGRPRKRPTGS